MLFVGPFSKWLSSRSAVTIARGESMKMGTESLKHVVLRVAKRWIGPEKNPVLKEGAARVMTRI
jgi:hypothetical protein